MKKFYTGVVKRRKLIIVMFLICFAVCFFLKNAVAVNYDMNDYLPSDAKSTISLDVMQDEFDSNIPNARVMVRNVTIPEALEYKEKIKNINGVLDVTWLDDSQNITVPIETLDQTVVENYYKDNDALFSVTIAEDSRISAVNEIRDIIGDDNAMTGSAVSTAVATTNTVKEIQKMTVIAVLFVSAVLILTTSSWFEPVIVLLGLGVAIIINSGTNLIFGEVSFVTNAAGSILQLAVSLDYSVFLIHRFEECRKETTDVNDAMVNALCKSTSSILSSGLTTVIGFLALMLMQFKIGPDLGRALAKGVAISLLTVFLFMPSVILSSYKLLDKTAHKSFMPDFRGFGKIVNKIAVPMICIFAIVIVPSFLASNSNSYHYGSSHIYGEGTTYGRDKEMIENVFGKNDTYVLLVPKGDNVTQKELSDELHKIPQISDIISYVDTVGREIPEEYLDDDTLSLLESKNYSRFVISVDADYEGDDTFDLVKTIRETANKYYPDEFYLAGEGISTYDLMDTITADMTKVNLLAIGAVFVVLLLTMKSLSVPVILVLSIETAIWLNLSVPYFSDKTVFYIAYLIISSVQLGATVDYAILMTERYKENRLNLGKHDAVIQTISDVSVSILTSGSVLTAVGLLLGYISTNQLLAQLGIFIGRGAIFSLVIVLFVLPGLLMMFDKLVINNKKNRRLTKMKKTTNQILAVMLTLVIAIGAVPLPASASQENTEKEEVVYVSLNSDGSVKEINVVNIFDLDEDGQIIDYGKYDSLRNMTTTDKINKNDDEITIDASEGKLYYEGRLSNNTIPWLIDIRYYIDGVEYSAKETAGKSGRLDIKISIKQNHACDDSFFDGYALQATLLLDTDIASDISADGATIANVGSSKQLTYTILPGKEKDISVSADVTDFEMDAISINAVRMNLDIDIDDEKIHDKIDEVINAVNSLDEGAGKVNDASSEIYNATGRLNSASEELKNGVSSLYNGAGDLSLGLNSLTSRNKELTDAAWTAYEGLCTAAQTQLNEKLSSYGLEKITLTPENYSDVLMKVLAGMDADTIYKTAYNEALSKVTSQVDAQADTLYKEYINSQADSIYMEYIKSQSDALYAQVASQAVINQLIENGYTKEQASAYIQTEEGKAVVANSVSEMTDSQKEQILTMAVRNLTADQKTQILKGASDTLTDKQKSAIKEAYIKQLMAGDEVTGQINAAVKAANLAAGQVSELKGQLDNYGAFYDGLVNYTGAVSSAANGAATLADGLSQLNDNTVTFKDSVGRLDSAMGSLYDGTGRLKEGTEEFVSKTEDIDTGLDDEIDSELASITGKDVETKSFVSDRNTNIKSVQFVIKGEKISMNEIEEAPAEEPEHLNFWQKLIRLFGFSK